MKLCVAKDPEMYAVLTTELAQQNVARNLNMEFKCIPGATIASRTVERDDEVGVFMFHAATAHIHGFTTKTLRWLFPKAKLICLGSDTIWHLARMQNEINDPADVDLWLDTMDEVIYEYNKNSIRTKKWLWTISESVLGYMETKQRKEKSNDFIGLFKINSPYRQSLVNTIKNNGYSIIHGGMGIGYNLDDLFSAYSKSRYVLGTTSPSWNNSNIRTMKGFRDWLGPACGTPLIYDDHIDVMMNFECPNYNYNDLSTIFSLTKELDKTYNNVLNNQLSWLKANTLEKQFKKAIEAVI